MNINTRNLNFVKFNNEEMQWVKFNGVTVYEAWKKLIVSGVPPLKLLNCGAKDLVDYKIYGESVQQTYTGKNLVDFSALTYTKPNGNNLNYSWNNNILTLERTNVNNSAFISTTITLPKGTYTISISNIETSYSKNNDNIIYSGKFGSIYIGAEKKTFVVEEETEQIAMNFYISDGSNRIIGNKISVNIQIEEGSVATEYEPYVGGVASPNPDYPQEVESVGERTKNLFNGVLKYGQFSWGDSGAYRRIEITLEAGTYTLSFSSQIFKQSSNITFVSGAGTFQTNTFTLTETTDCYFQFRGSNETTGTTEEFYNSLKVQIEKNDTPTEYEPYGYKIPVKTSGNNLFNKNDKDVQIGRIYVDGSVNKVGITDRMASGFIPVKPNTVYSQPILHDTSYRVGFYDSSYNYIGESVNRTYNFTTIDNTSYVRVTLPLAQLDTYVVVEGKYTTLESIPPYEPYQEPVTTNIYLDEPLRKIGDYIDYIDFENGKVIRNIKRYVATGKESIVYTQLLNEKYYYVVNMSNYEPSIIGTVPQCNYLKGVNGNITMANIPLYGVRWGGYAGAYNFVVDIATLDEFKSWLSTLYNSNNPLHIDYVLKTPIEEEIELPNIPTIKGTTILEINTDIQPSNLEVVYKGKR